MVRHVNEEDEDGLLRGGAEEVALGGHQVDAATLQLGKRDVSIRSTVNNAYRRNGIER